MQTRCCISFASTSWALPFVNRCVVNSGTFLPLMTNPHQVLDYDNWLNKSLNNIKPYRIPPLSNDIVTKLHNQLDASSDRIWRTRSAEEAPKIIQLLRELINSHTEEHTYKFSWNLSLYKNPPKKANKVSHRNCLVVLYLLVIVPNCPIIHLFFSLTGARVYS